MSIEKPEYRKKEEAAEVSEGVLYASLLSTRRRRGERLMSDKYAVVGNPIDHTKSPLIHLSFANEPGQNIDYVAIEAPIGSFNEVVDKFRREAGFGRHITEQFNLAAFAYCTHLSKRARPARAGNAI